LDLGRGISPSQGLYLNTGQHRHGINAQRQSGIRIHDPSVRAGEDSSCLRPRGHCDRRCTYKLIRNIEYIKEEEEFESAEMKFLRGGQTKKYYNDEK
jgi:hypothetical protein